jgi:hypothetical protein
MTSVRARPSHVKPRELREEEELATIPKFHARPLKYVRPCLNGRHENCYLGLQLRP